MEALITIRDVARRFQVSARQVRNLVKQGKAPAPVRLGGAVRWRERDIDAFIARNCELQEARPHA